MRVCVCAWQSYAAWHTFAAAQQALESRAQKVLRILKNGKVLAAFGRWAEFRLQMKRVQVRILIATPMPILRVLSG